jgi:transketolase
MQNISLQLNPHLFDKDVEQKPTRAGYGEGLLLAGKENKHVVALCADLTESTQTHLFAKAFPERFFEMGVAEQNMASVASGFAAMGKIPFISSYAMFSPGRNWEQIRTTICYNNANVKIAGAHAGVSVGPDGGTHQAIEDIALMRVIPRMTIFNPCDAIEAKKATLWAARHEGPTYIRLAREKTPLMTTEQTPFAAGRAYPYILPKERMQVAILATGPLLYEALRAVDPLREHGIVAGVLHVPTIKPLPHHDILNFVRDARLVLTVEEHQVLGGFGSAVSELLSSEMPKKIGFIGVHDQFGQSGEPAELIAHYEMNTGSIVAAARRLLE